MVNYGRWLEGRATAFETADRMIRRAFPESAEGRSALMKRLDEAMREPMSVREPHTNSSVICMGNVFGRRIIKNKNIQSVLDRNGDGFIVYHGSNKEITTPDWKYGRERTDFGQGFYVTNDLESAWDIAVSTCHRKGTGVATVTSYYFDYAGALNNLTTYLQVYWEPDDDWADFIIKNRSGDVVNNLELVIGPIADKRILEIIRDYMIHKDEPGKYRETVESIKENLIGTEDTMQIDFRSDRALQYLDYLGSS